MAGEFVATRISHGDGSSTCGKGAQDDRAKWSGTPCCAADHRRHTAEILGVKLRQEALWL